MVGYWPTATGELADRINATPKLVVSTTPEELAWQNARQLLVDDDLPGLAVTPVALGEGQPLFAAGAPRRTLSLRAAQPLPSGALLVSYTPLR
jgi:hypothetical protein